MQSKLEPHGFYLVGNYWSHHDWGMEMQVLNRQIIWPDNENFSDWRLWRWLCCIHLTSWVPLDFRTGGSLGKEAPKIPALWMEDLAGDPWKAGTLYACTYDTAHNTQIYLVELFGFSDWRSRQRCCGQISRWGRIIYWAEEGGGGVINPYYSKDPKAFLSLVLRDLQTAWLGSGEEQKCLCIPEDRVGKHYQRPFECSRMFKHWHSHIGQCKIHSHYNTNRTWWAIEQQQCPCLAINIISHSG